MPPTAGAKDASPTFFHTEDSDEWVTRSIHVQAKYRRVLVVDASGRAPQRVSVPVLQLNSRSKPDGPAREYKVAGSYRTLQEAADAAQGGDLIAVMPGHYAGFVLEDKPSAGDGRYVHFKAMGEPGDVVIDQPSRVPDWMILLRATHHVIVQGFNLAGPNTPGQQPIGPRAGILLDGDFEQTGKQTHHIVLVGNFSHNHRKWGFHTRATHTVLIQDNLFALSAEEHSGYVSDGSDNYVIRRNVFFGSNSGGLQCNLDSVSSFHDLIKNSELRGYPQEQPTGKWAVQLVKLATEKIGGAPFQNTESGFESKSTSSSACLLSMRGLGGVCGKGATITVRSRRQRELNCIVPQERKARRGRQKRASFLRLGPPSASSERLPSLRQSTFQIDW